MSFGFSAGDFIAAIQLANDIRKEFADAPSQFKAVSDEIRSLSIVLQDADVAFPKQELNNDQRRDLEDIDKGCRNILDELQKILDKFSELGSESGSVGRRIKRVWKRFKWKPEDIDELRSRITANIGFLTAFNGRLTRDNVVKLVQRQENQEWQAILNWLTPIDFVSQQNDFITRRQEGTGQWLLDSTEYQSWQEKNTQTLFCPGIPGAGKTILTSVVIKELTTRFSNDSTVGIAYIYFNFRRKDEQKIEDLLASLLKQLAESQPSLPGPVKELYDQYKPKRTRPSVDELSRSLQAVTRLYSQVFIVVDGLDECQNSNRCRSKFLSSIFDLQVQTRAKLFATSRPNLDIEKEFKGCLSLEILASDEDIRRYLNSNMSQLPTCVLRKPELQEQITTEITEAVKGMFLLAQLYLASLGDKTTAKAIKSSLKQLQKKSLGASEDKKIEILSSAYDEALERINGQQAGFQLLANNVLSWITCAKRPLTTRELQHAIAVEIGELELDEENLPDIEDIISVCAGLVTIDEQSGIIRLVHYTTQEYFERTQQQWFPNAEVNITKICVTYLSFNEFENGICQNDKEFEERLHSKPLYDYAAHNWGPHAREAYRAFASIPEVVTFLEKEAQVEASSQALLVEKEWLEHKKYSQEFQRQITGVLLAALLGVEPAVQLLLEKGADVNTATRDDGSTPLYGASGGGHVEVVRLLLEKGADANAATIEDRWTPLYVASEGGHVEVVRLLLEKGADVNAATIEDGSTPLYVASEGGHIEVIRLLLEKGADVNAATIKDRWTPLHRASKGGHVEVVWLLLEKGADVNTATIEDGWTPLHRASEGGHVEVVRLLLEKGADVNTATIEDGLTPLCWASSSGHVEVVRLLLEKGADVNAATIEDRWTPLHRASEGGHIEIVRLLLEKGADVNAATIGGPTPLYGASEGGHIEVIRLLLNKGADVNTATRDRLTPLYRASGGGHVEVIRLLLSKGADVNTATRDGLTPLYRASESGYIEIVQLLLEKGADINAATIGGPTPLYGASEGGHIEVVRLLLNKGADVNTATRDRLTPLYRASGGGHVEVIRLLLSKGADVNTATRDGLTPLYRASGGGHVEVIRLLLNKGADVNTATRDGLTPLYRASGGGHVEIVRLLLDKGADVNTATIEGGWTPLYRASENGHVEIVRLLLEKGADVNAATRNGLTPLCWASSSGHVEVVRLLLENGADVNAATIEDGWTPLYRASERGHIDVVRLLLEKGADVNAATIKDA